MKKLLKLNLLQKLISLYITIIAIPMIFFGFLFFNNIQDSALKEQEKTMISELENVKNEIEKNAEVCQRVIQIILGDNDLLHALYPKKPMKTKEIINFKNKHFYKLEDLINTNLDILGIRLHLKNLEIPEMWPIIYNEKRSDKLYWYKNAKKSENQYIWIYDEADVISRKSLNESKKNVSVVREIQFPKNQHLGFVEVTMLENVFFDGLFNTNSEDSILFVVTEDGKSIIDHENQTITQLNISPQDFIELYNEKRIQDGPDEEILTIVHNGVRYIMGRTELKLTRTMLYKISIDKTSIQLNKTRNIVVLGTIGLILILTMITYFMTSVLTKKLRLIIKSMRKVENGELDIDISSEGYDEMDELAYHFKVMMTKINHLVNVVIKKEAATKEAEISALQAQINHHFIYNVLEAINMMAEINDEEEISEAVTSLGRLMRYSMSWKNPFVTMKDELDNVQNYFNLVNIRFYKQAYLEIQIDQELMQTIVPKMLLQPIVENSIVHGLEPIGEGGVVKINGTRLGNRVVICIEDNGMGLSHERLEAVNKYIQSNEDVILLERKGNGIGLRNLNNRIKLTYGDSYGIKIDSVQGKHTKVIIEVPG